MEGRGPGRHGAAGICRRRLRPLKFKAAEIVARFAHTHTPVQHLGSSGQTPARLFLRQRQHQRLVRRQRDLQRLTKPRFAAVQPGLRIEAHHLEVLCPRLDAEVPIQPQGQGLRPEPGIAKRHQTPVAFPVRIAVGLPRHFLVVREMRHLPLPPHGRQDGSGFRQQRGVAPRPLQQPGERLPPELIQPGGVYIERQERMTAQSSDHGIVHKGLRCLVYDPQHLLRDDRHRHSRRALQIEVVPCGRVALAIDRRRHPPPRGVVAERPDD